VVFGDVFGNDLAVGLVSYAVELKLN
jgi:hypothetical protein